MNFIIPTDFHIFQKGWNHQPLKPLPSGKHLRNYGKSSFLLGKHIVNGHCFLSICFLPPLVPPPCQVAYITGERSVPRLRMTPVPAGTKKLQRLGHQFGRGPRKYPWVYRGWWGILGEDARKSTGFYRSLKDLGVQPIFRYMGGIIYMRFDYRYFENDHQFPTKCFLRERYHAPF